MVELAGGGSVAVAVAVTLFLWGSSSEDRWGSQELRYSTHYKIKDFPFHVMVREIENNVEHLSSRGAPSGIVLGRHSNFDISRVAVGYWGHVTRDTCTIGLLNFCQNNLNMVADVFYHVFGCTDPPQKISAWLLNSFILWFVIEITMGITMGNKPENRISFKTTFLMVLVQFWDHLSIVMWRKSQL